MNAWRDLADRGRLRTHVPLAPLTTYKLGGPARLLVDVDDAADLESLAAGLEETPLPVLVLGRGSNVLIADGLAPSVDGRNLPALKTRRSTRLNSSGSRSSCRRF